MEPVLILFFLGLAVAIYFLRSASHENSIRREIESMGGSVITIERRNFFTGIGPFHVVGKGRVVYRILYTVNSESREGWVRFGSLFGPDWRL